MKDTLLQQAQERYKRGDQFLSATGNLKKPLTVTTPKMSEIYKNTIVDSDAGVLYTEGVWAKIV